MNLYNNPWARLRTKKSVNEERKNKIKCKRKEQKKVGWSRIKYIVVTTRHMILYYDFL